MEQPKMNRIIWREKNWEKWRNLTMIFSALAEKMWFYKYIVAGIHYEKHWQFSSNTAHFKIPFLNGKYTFNLNAVNSTKQLIETKNAAL